MIHLQIALISLPSMSLLIQHDNNNDSSTNNSDHSQLERTGFEVVRKASQRQVTQDNTDELLKCSRIKGEKAREILKTGDDA